MEEMICYQPGPLTSLTDNLFIGASAPVEAPLHEQVSSPANELEMSSKLKKVIMETEFNCYCFQWHKMFSKMTVFTLLLLWKSNYLL